MRNGAVATDNYRYPFLTAQDRFVPRKSEPDGPLDPAAAFRTHHYLDPHVFGPAAAQRHEQAQTDAKEPDVKLLWIVGSNAVGQVANAEEKRAALAQRSGASLPPAGATTQQIIDTLTARMNEGGLAAVQQEIYPNPTTEFADLVLPARGRGEEDFVRFAGERRLRLYGRFQDPPPHTSGELRCEADWRVFADVARALLPEGTSFDGAGTLPDGHTLDQPLTAANFGWQRSPEVFDELTAAGRSNLAGDFRLDRLGAGGHDRLRRRGPRGYLIPLAENPDQPPDLTPQGDDVRSLRRAPGLTKTTLKDETGADVEVRFASHFVRADWRTIAHDFEQNRPRATGASTSCGIPSSRTFATRPSAPAGPTHCRARSSRSIPPMRRS